MSVRRSIQTQILLPFSVTVIVAVAVIAIASGWLALRQAEQRTLLQLRGVTETLNRLTVPFTDSVLNQMRGLSGAEFVAIDRHGRIPASTLPEAATAEITATLTSLPPRSPQTEQSLSELPVIAILDTRFLADRVRVQGPENVDTLIVLYPEADWRDARRAALWPPLIVGGVTMAVVIGISAALARSIGRRVQTVQQLLAAIAAGESPATAAPATPRDELDDLVVSATRLSAELDRLQHTVQQTERVRLLGQLAGGLAHQLRNAVTGARLAVQLHQKRCGASRPENAPRSEDTDESLAVALRQLALTEDQIQRLLSLSRQESPDATPCRLSEAIVDIERLIRPHAEHARVELTVPAEVASEPRIPDGERFRAAIMNLLLNAIEAAGSGGHVALDVRPAGDALAILVSDDGPGPSADVAATLFDPFVTSKPEGVGLGLALARQVAQDFRGDLSWSRQQGRTVFEFLLPVTDDRP